MSYIPTIVVNAENLAKVILHKDTEYSHIFDNYEEEDWKYYHEFIEDSINTTCEIGGVEICLIEGFDTSVQNSHVRTLLDELGVEYGTIN